MVDALSSDDAVGEIECLEDKIMLDEGKQGMEEVVRTTVRLEKWQREMARWIKNDLNTRYANVYRNAIHHGEKVLREEIGESSDNNYLGDTDWLYGYFINHIRGFSDDMELVRDISRRIDGKDHDVELRTDDELTDDPITVNYNESVGSSIHDKWEQLAYVSKSDAIRVLLTIGLGYSKWSEQFAGDIPDEMFDDTVRLFEETRDNIECSIKVYCQRRMHSWMDEGLCDEEAEILKESVEYMDTEHKDDVRSILGNFGVEFEDEDGSEEDEGEGG